jgi:putative phosphoesterase
MRIAVLSDIHGNSWALKEVLKDIKTRNPDLLVNLGDILYGPLDPKGTFEMLQSIEMISISGNQDRSITECFETEASNDTMEFVLNQLNAEAYDWLKNLPKTKVLDCGVFLCHGTAHSDMTYLLEQLNQAYVSVNKPDKIDELLVGVSQQIVFCGHSHFARFIQTKHRAIINPGSVGLPAFDDKLPQYHKIENFHHHARYCMVEIEYGRIKTEQFSIPYDYEKATEMASRNNRPDWAGWIRTGTVISER